MRPNHLTYLVAVGVALLAASAVAEPSKTTLSVATEQIVGGMLTVTPNQPSVNSVLRITGPEGYTASVDSPTGGSVSANLMAEGRFPPEGELGPIGSASVRDGRYLPDGRYRYEGLFHLAGGKLRRHAGTFFVEAGAVIPRSAKQDDLARLRRGLLSEKEAAASVSQSATDVMDALSILDTEQDYLTFLRMDSFNHSTLSIQNYQGNLGFRLLHGYGFYDVMTFSDSGRLGVGTTNPMAKLDIASASPSLRFSDIVDTEQTWEIVGDDLGFRVRDVSNNTTPFVIDPGAPSFSFGLNFDGGVGIGGSSPAKLTVADSGFITTLRLQAGSQFRDLRAFSDGGFQIDDTQGRRSMRIFPGTPDNALVLRNGRVGLMTVDPQETLHVAGNGRIDGDVALGSSRSLKTAFESVAPRELLAKVTELPISSWRYKEEDRRHIGPVAEDFQRLFGLGDGKTISVIDAQGVAIAAIQGLLLELDRKDGEIAALTDRLVAVESSLPAQTSRARPATERKGSCTDN